MDTNLKLYLLLVDYGAYEGMRIVEMADTFDEIMELRLTRDFYGGPVLIVKQVDYSLKEEDI